MLDRDYVTRAVTAGSRSDQDNDPVSEVMISSLRALSALGDDSLRESIGELSRDDPSLRVRQAALEALKALEQRP